MTDDIVRETEYSPWRDGKLYGCDCDRPHEHPRDCTTIGATRERYQLEREFVEGVAIDSAYFVDYERTSRGWRVIDRYDYCGPKIMAECEDYFGPAPIVLPQASPSLHVCVTCKGMNSYKAQKKIEAMFSAIHGVRDVSSDILTRDVFVVLDTAILCGEDLWERINGDPLLRPTAWEVVEADEDDDDDDGPPVFEDKWRPICPRH